MKTMSFWKKLLGLLLCVVMLCTLFAWTSASAYAEEDNENENETVDYVLILSCTNKSADAQPEVREAAAKMLVDLLPVDNARVAVFYVGKDATWNENNRRYETTDKNGKKIGSYIIQYADDPISHLTHIGGCGNTPYDQWRMRCVYQLWGFDDGIETQDQRKELKAGISDVFDADQGQYSDTHIAIYAAIDYLKATGSKNACILLVSENFSAVYQSYWIGENRKEARDLNPLGENQEPNPNGHSMYQDIEADIKAHHSENSAWVMNWVNLGGKKQDDDTHKKITELCKISGGVYTETEDVMTLPQDITQVIDRFISGENRLPKHESVKGKPVEITLGENGILMATEANVVITGNGVKSIRVENADGQELKNDTDYYWNSEVRSQKDNKHLYSAVKIIRPIGGEKIIVNAREGSTVYYQEIRTLEPDILLESSVKPGTNVRLNTDVELSIALQYQGRTLNCGRNAYEELLPNVTLSYSAKNGSSGTIPIEINEAENGYKASFKLTEDTSYSFSCKVVSDQFKAGERSSNRIDNISVNNNAPKAVSGIRTNDSYPVGSIAALEQTENGFELVQIDESELLSETFADVHNLFTDEDEVDPKNLTPEIVCREKNRKSKEVELWDSAEFASGYLVIRMPEQAGEYSYELTVSDPKGMEAEKPITFDLNVVNQPPVLNGNSPIEVRMIANAPAFLVSLGLLPKEECRDYTVNLNELFTDPDGLKLSFDAFDDATKDEDGKDIVTFSFDDANGAMTVVAKRKGQASITLFATDSSNEFASAEIRFTVVQAGSVLLARYWWVLAILAVLLVITILALITKKVRGAWSVTVAENGMTRFGSVDNLTTLPNMSKSKVSLLSAAVLILNMNNINWQPNIPDAVHLNGTVLPGKCKVKVDPGMVVLKNGNQIDKRSFVMKAGEQITFLYANGTTITAVFQ